jgi:hypothetical protein
VSIEGFTPARLLPPSALDLLLCRIPAVDRPPVTCDAARWTHPRRLSLRRLTSLFLSAIIRLSTSSSSTNVRLIGSSPRFRWQLRQAVHGSDMVIENVRICVTGHVGGRGREVQESPKLGGRLRCHEGGGRPVQEILINGQKGDGQDARFGLSLQITPGGPNARSLA